MITKCYDVAGSDGKINQTTFFVELYDNYHESRHKNGKIVCFDVGCSAHIDERKIYHADACTIITHKSQKHAAEITGDDERISCVKSLLEEISEIKLKEVPFVDHRK